MISKATRARAVEVLDNWSEDAQVDPQAIAQLLGDLSRVPGNSSWKASLASIAREFGNANDHFDRRSV